MSRRTLCAAIAVMAAGVMLGQTGPPVVGTHRLSLSNESELVIFRNVLNEPAFAAAATGFLTTGSCSAGFFPLTNSSNLPRYYRGNFDFASGSLWTRLTVNYENNLPIPVLGPSGDSMTTTTATFIAPVATSGAGIFIRNELSYAFLVNVLDVLPQEILDPLSAGYQLIGLRVSASPGGTVITPTICRCVLLYQRGAARLKINASATWDGAMFGLLKVL